MTKAFWNKRYASETTCTVQSEFILAEQYRVLRGPVLSLSEGEGRNAVFWHRMD